MPTCVVTDQNIKTFADDGTEDESITKPSGYKLAMFNPVTGKIWCGYGTSNGSHTSIEGNTYDPGDLTNVATNQYRYVSSDNNGVVLDVANATAATVNVWGALYTQSSQHNPYPRVAIGTWNESVTTYPSNAALPIPSGVSGSNLSRGLAMTSTHLYVGNQATDIIYAWSWNRTSGGILTISTAASANVILKSGHSVDYLGAQGDDILFVTDRTNDKVWAYDISSD